MSLNALVLNCLIADKHITESGCEVTATAISKELILFFNLKDQAEAGSILRKEWNMKQDELLCDAIVLYSKSSSTDNTFCLVELKGSNIAHASAQILHTYEVMKASLLKETHLKKLVSQIVWKACIRLSGASPQDTKSIQTQLQQVFGKQNVTIGRDRDISNFLRS